MPKKIILSLLIVLQLSLLSTPLSAKTLKIMTWNLEWLSSHGVAQFPASERRASDVQILARYFAANKPDILAFQEVNDLKAIKSIVGSNYRIFLSDRAKPDNKKHQFSDINQFTGFAIREGIKVTDKPDIKLDRNKRSKLRLASYLLLNEKGHRPIHLLSVHLKAGCTGKYHSNHSCKVLKKEAKHLNHWIAKRQRSHDRYIILGDFNHQLVHKKDWLWKIISKNISPQPQRLTLHTKSRCLVRSKRHPNKTYHYYSMIDHIIASPDIQASEASQQLFLKPDVLRYQLSDHCPLTANIQ
ncbi:endonuclease/exonuclease/phosphatase family protein [Vibrio profundum]|uniref:endonuclease/exonuclease/phosphatase family protein n=1 Tax=Vibrio profundum TaxID=2910247 RepID=UPI003D0CCD2D